MSQDRWTAVDHYLTDCLVAEDNALRNALAASTAAGLPAIAVSAPQGKLLHLFAKALGAKRILEIGTLGGYSTIWLARALPGPPVGKLISLEISPEHAEVARTNLARAGQASLAEVRTGRALDLLPAVLGECGRTFDLAFIDADKPSNPDYLLWAQKLVRPGGFIIVDNVIREGEVVDAESQDDRVRGVRRMNEMIAADSRLSATAIQTVGAKGYDGFCLIRVGEG